MMTIVLGIGSFERTGGEANSSSDAFAISDYDASSSFWNDTLAISEAEAFDNPPGNAIGHAQSVGESVIPTATNASTVAPQVSSSLLVDFSVTDDYASATSNNTNSIAQFDYESDPEFEGDLVLHGHLYIQATGSGNPGTGITNEEIWLLARIGGVYGPTIFASGEVRRPNEPMVFEVTSLFIPEENNHPLDANTTFEQNEGAGFHIHFEMPWTDGSIELQTEVDGDISGIVTNSTATSSWQIVSSAWAYVTPEGTDLQDGDFDQDGDVDGDDLGIWEAGAPQADANEDGQITQADYSLWLNSAAPKVKNVTIGSTVGSQTPHSFDTEDGSGSQLKTVPVGNANLISVQFTKDVMHTGNGSNNLVNGDLEFIALNKVVAEPTATIIQQPSSGNNYTAVWSLSASLPTAQYVMRLADTIVDLDGTALDGEWTNPGSISSTNTSVFPSGDNDPGGDFEFVFTILPGDINRNATVDVGDLGVFSGFYPSSGTNWLSGDFNGNGQTDIGDLGLLGSSYTTNWQTLNILGDYNNDHTVNATDETTFNGYHPSDARADLDKDSDVDSADDAAFAALKAFDFHLQLV